MQNPKSFTKKYFYILNPLNHLLQFIENEMSNLGWTIEEDKFEQDTVIGNVEFTNVIATLDPNAPRRMVIACMYIESAGFICKYF